MKIQNRILHPTLKEDTYEKYKYDKALLMKKVVGTNNYIPYSSTGNEIIFERKDKLILTLKKGNYTYGKLQLRNEEKYGFFFEHDETLILLEAVDKMIKNKDLRIKKQILHKLNIHTRLEKLKELNKYTLNDTNTTKTTS